VEDKVRPEAMSGVGKHLNLRPPPGKSLQLHPSPLSENSSSVEESEGSDDEVGLEDSSIEEESDKEVGAKDSSIEEESDSGVGSEDMSGVRGKPVRPFDEWIGGNDSFPFLRLEVKANLVPLCQLHKNRQEEERNSPNTVLPNTQAMPVNSRPIVTGARFNCIDENDNMLHKMRMETSETVTNGSSVIEELYILLCHHMKKHQLTTPYDFPYQ
jgi:hypothetical protein